VFFLNRPHEKGSDKTGPGVSGASLGGVCALSVSGATGHGAVQVAVGKAVLPSGRLAWKPNSPLCPGARLLLKLTPWYVTVCPLIDWVAFQNPVMACPAGSVTVTVQPVMFVVPVFVTRDGWMT
jgi:hypothetical protein